MSHLMATLFEGRPSLVALDAGPALVACLAAAMNDPRASELLAAHAAADDGFWPDPAHWMSAYRPYRVVEGVLQIPVRGVLLAGLSVAWGTYATGYPYIRKALDRGLADPGVKGIALICDTLGGTVAECFDLADHIHASRGGKPIRAFAHERAYSAGYLLASSADVIVVARTGGVGSIGVVVGHRDESAALDKAGIRNSFVFFGKHKIDGTSTAPLPDGVRQRMQAGVDRLGEMFVDTVARNRGLAAEVVRATEALTYSAAEAVENGLADEIGPLDEAVAAFVASLTLDPQDETMSTLTREAHEAALTSARAEAVTAASARVTTILADPRSKGRERAALQLASSSPSMSTEDVLAFVVEHAPSTAARNRLDVLMKDVAIDAAAPEANQGPDELWASAVEAGNKSLRG